MRVTKHPKINFACADINCSLCVFLKGNGGFKYFNTMEELEKFCLTYLAKVYPKFLSVRARIV